MARSLFIRPVDVFKNTLIQADLDPDKLIPFIEAFQDTELQDFLGENLYTTLDDLVWRSGQTPVQTPNINEADYATYKTFITDHLRRIVEQGAAAIYMRYGKYTISNKGNFVHTATDGRAMTDAEEQDVINKINGRKEFYMERTLDYLCTQNPFAEFSTTSTSDLPPSYETYNWGFEGI